MEHTHLHHDHGTHSTMRSGTPGENYFNLALSATLHCLLGCGLGEVLGMAIATYWNMSMTASAILAIVLGFVFGFLLGILPLRKKGFTFRRAFKIVLVAEGLSILVMEAFELATQLVIPGVMMAGLSDAIFWIGMIASLAVGFLAALPVNYYMIKKGVRHQH